MSAALSASTSAAHFSKTLAGAGAPLIFWRSRSKGIFSLIFHKTFETIGIKSRSFASVKVTFQTSNRKKYAKWRQNCIFFFNFIGEKELKKNIRFCHDFAYFILFDV
jgi:hypothetical protein